MDLVAAVMRDLHLSAAGYRRLELAAPWAISFGQAGLRGIHIVVKGRCEAVFDRGALQPLEQGDLIIAPRADAHVLRSPGAAHTPVISAAALAAQKTNGRIRLGGDGEKTVILCGAFAFGETGHPSLAGLPRIVHVRGAKGHPPRWLRGYIDALMTEAQDVGPGSDVVMARLSAAIVTRALRDDSGSATSPGWLKGLSDPFIAKALGALHDVPARPWTVEVLARHAGLSRAAFAARFCELVGEPPMHYLYALRMQRAGQMLREGKNGLGQIAEAVGYRSEAAFCAAFKRHAGVSPGQFRKDALHASASTGPSNSAIRSPK
jgi:AraC-like DNA-binding protein